MWRLLLGSLLFGAMCMGCGGTEEPAKDQKDEQKAGAKPADNDDPTPSMPPGMEEPK